MTAPARTTIIQLPAIADGDLTGGVLAMDDVNGITGKVTFPQIATAVAPSLPSSAKYRVPFVYGSDDGAGPGSYTHTVSAGVTHVEMEAWGPGGASHSGQSGGGGGGAYAFAPRTVVPASTIAIVVGAGAIAAATVAGGNTTVNGTELVAGSGGLSSSGSGGAGGTWSSTLAGAYGIDGGIGGSDNSGSHAGSNPQMAHGGDGARGGQGAVVFANIVGTLGAGAGILAGDREPMQPGGGGASTPGNVVWGGADGLVIIWEYT